MNDLISVILPTYNVAPYLARCLDSILANTYKNLEIIIVDDASPDNSSEIYAQYAAVDSRFRIVKHEKNLGVSAARNNGLHAATGDFVHFFDPDDWVCPNFYEKMHSNAVRMGADMTMSRFFYVNDDTGPSRLAKESLRPFEDRKDKMKILDGHGTGVCWRYLFKKEFLIRNKLAFPTMARYEDTFFMIDVMKSVNFVGKAPDAFYYYHYDRPGSVMNSKLTEHAKQDTKALTQIARDLFGNDLSGYLMYRLKRKILGMPALRQMIIYLYLRHRVR